MLVAATDVRVATVYNDTIFSEPAVIAGFLLFAYGSLQYRKHHDAPYALVAVLGAHLALSTKEVSFTFLGATSVTYIPIGLVDRLGKNESDVDHSSYVLPKAVAAILDYRIEMAQLYQAAVYLCKPKRENPGPITVVLDGQYPWMVNDFLLYARRLLGVRVVRADEPQQGDYVAVLSRDRRHVEQHFGGERYRQVFASHDVFGGVFQSAQAKKRSYVFQFVVSE